MNGYKINMGDTAFLPYAVRRIFLIPQRIKPQLYSFFLNNTEAAKIYTDKQSP